MLPKFKPYVLLFYLLFGLALPAYAQNPPGFSKSFSPDTIGPGSVSTLTFLINNAEIVSTATDLAFTDTLPAGVTIATPANASSTCGGTLTAPDGSSTITFSGGSVGADSTCSITVDVTSSTAGTHTNVSGDLTSSEGNSGSASDDLTVTTNRPGFSKAFSPSSVFFGGRSTLTFTIDNTANGSQAFNLAFTDNLPAGVVVADPANATSTCASAPFTGGVITAEPGESVISLSSAGLAGSNVAAGASCTVSVDVVATGNGTLTNVSEELFSSSGGPSVSSGKASAALTVTSSEVILTKSFADDPTPPGSTTPLVFSITNLNRSNSATNIAFTDDLDATLSGLVATGLPQNNVCGSGSQLTGTSTLALTGGNLAADGGTCTFTVTLQIPAGAATGEYTNTTSNVSANLGGTPGVHNPASDTLFVEPGPLLTKSFSDKTLSAGDTVTVEFSITNTSPTSSATEITFQDNLDQFMSGVQVTDLPASGFCGAGSTITTFSSGGELILLMAGGNLAASGSCNFSVDLLIPPDQSNGSFTNTTTKATATVDGTTATGTAGSDTLTVVAPPLLGKTFIDDPVISGGAVELEFRLNLDENAPTDATNIAFTDDLSATLPGLTATGLPQSDVCGAGSQISGTTNLSFSGGTLAAASSCIFTVTLQTPDGATLGDYTNTTSNITADVGGMAVTGNQAVDELSIFDLALTKSFPDDPVLPGGSATLEFTLVNSSTVSTATNIAFTDNLNNALSGLASTSGSLNDICGSGSSLTGTSNLIFTGGNLAPGTSCTFSVSVDVPAGAAEGKYNNVTSGVQFEMNSSSFTAGPATDALEVQKNVLLLSKNFGSSTAFAGDNVTLVFSMTNSFSEAATGIAFTDDLDAALSGLSATGLPANDVCGAGSQLTGTTLLSLTGGNLTAGATCVFSVTLQIPGAASAGDYTNTTSGVAGSIGGLAVTGDAAADDLQVIDPSSSGQIIVDKVTDPAGDPTSFDFILDSSEAGFSRVTFSLTDAAEPVATTVEANGVYSITETVPAGWDLSDSTCSDGSSIDGINIGPGEIVTCIITNTISGQIVVDKVTDPAGDPTSFDFTLSGSSMSFSPIPFSLTDAATPFTATVQANEVYSITETVPTGWSLSGSTCSDSSSIDAINISPGEMVTCIITNTLTSPPVTDLYLPIILKNATFLPDLVIDSFAVNSNQVTIRVRNAGLATIPANDEFWVQIVFNNAPTGVNQRWDTLSNQGALWGVVSPAIPLAPDATFTLNLNDIYYYDGLNPPGGPANNVPSPIPVGTTVYAQVDAIDFSTTHGVVLESNENNNIVSTVSVAGTSLRQPSAADGISNNPSTGKSLPRLKN